MLDKRSRFRWNLISMRDSIRILLDLRAWNDNEEKKGSIEGLNWRWMVNVENDNQDFALFDINENLTNARAENSSRIISLRVTVSERKRELNEMRKIKTWENAREFKILFTLYRVHEFFSNWRSLITQNCKRNFWRYIIIIIIIFGQSIELITRVWAILQPDKMVDTVIRLLSNWDPLVPPVILHNSQPTLANFKWNIHQDNSPTWFTIRPYNLQSTSVH